jgi:hypothetical protein
MEEAYRGESILPQLSKLIEAYRLLNDESRAEELEAALKWIAAMVKAGVSEEVIEEYIDRNIRLVQEEQTL